MKKYGCSDNRGYFDDASREYVITDMYPIRPWLNYLWSEQTVASVDQFGFGKSLAGIDGSRRKIDDGERLIYIKDNISGNFYSPNRNYGKLPMDDFRCVVGQGYQKIVSEYEGLRTTFTILVPSSGYAVLYHAEIEELRGKDRDLTIYFAVRPQANLTEHTSYGFADFDPKYQGLCFPHFAYQSPTDYSCLYFSSERKFKSYSVSKRDFCGTYGDWSAPESLSAKKLSSRGSTFEEEYAAVVEIPIKLRPHGKKMFAFSLAAGRSLEESGALASSLAKESVFRSELKKQCAYGKACERVFRAEMPDPFFQSLTNIWLKRQLSLGKSWGRIYGKGFRDVMQDIAAFVSLDVPLARQRILTTLSKQYKNGNTIRMFEPDLLLPYNDGASWIPATVSAYLKESGDFSVLEETVGYLDGGEDTVLDHMLRGVRYLSDDVGEHGLVLLRGGDWNDSLNGAGNNGIGESVWLSLATVKAAKECAEILDRIGKIKEKEELLLRAEKLSERVMLCGMSGGYFIYAYDDWGGTIGGETNREGSFYLNPQTWAVLSGVGGKELGEKVMDLAEERLKCSFGYTLCDPPYSVGNDHIGRISYFVPGMVENASVYVHGVMFKVAADCRLGRADTAFETLSSVTYANPRIRKSGVEPYAVTNMFIGQSNPYRAGDAPMSWVTGSAGWMYRNLTEEILGVKADFDGLILTPCLPSSWHGAYVERIFRGTTYKITYRRKGNKGGQSIFVDGEKISENLIVPKDGVKTVNVLAELE